MARIVEILGVCDVCKIRGPEDQMHMDNLWTWERKQYTFDLCSTCLPTVGQLPIDTLLVISALVPKNQSQKGNTAQGQRLSVRRRYNVPEYQRFYYSEETGKWKCPVCKKEMLRQNSLAAHCRETHDKQLSVMLSELLEGVAADAMPGVTTESKPSRSLSAGQTAAADSKDTRATPVPTT